MKISGFFVTQILREINFGGSRSSKTFFSFETTFAQFEKVLGPKSSKSGFNFKKYFLMKMQRLKLISRNFCKERRDGIQYYNNLEITEIYSQAFCKKIPSKQRSYQRKYTKCYFHEIFFMILFLSFFHNV